jgi:alpha-D-ribose 1-methylphosphonate 5-triphosphate synthase subunit PhnH
MVPLALDGILKPLIKEAPMSNALAQLRENRFDFVHDSQQTFRAMMMALAFPGIIRRLLPISLSFSEPDLSYVLQPLLTLLDLETSFCVVCRDNRSQAEITRYLELNTNSQARQLPQADFILCLDPSLNGRFNELKKGTLTQPNKSATVFYLLESLSELPDADALELYLSGPGIKDVQIVNVSGVDPDEIEQWEQNHNDYPLGIDIYLVSRSGNIIGIPRSVSLEKSGGR